MEIIIVCIAMLIGVQILMYWQLATQVEELQNQSKRQADQIKELQLMTESLILQQEQLYRDAVKIVYSNPQTN
jgi:hypothetical protein